MGNLCPCPKRKEKHPSYDLHEETFEIEENIDTPASSSKQKHNPAHSHRSATSSAIHTNNQPATQEPEKESIIQAEIQYTSESKLEDVNSKTRKQPRNFQNQKSMEIEDSPKNQIQSQPTPEPPVIPPTTATSASEPPKEKKVYSFQKKNVDPNNYRFLKEQNTFKVKAIDSIKQQQFNIDSCEGCTFFIFDVTANVYVDKCSDCFIYCAPCESTVFLRDCKNIRMIGITKQFRIRDCFDCEFSLYCNSQPVIQSSNNIVFTTYPQNLGYPQLSDQFKKSRMEVWNNHWSEIHDFTKKAGEKHFELRRLLSYQPEWERGLKEAHLQSSIALIPSVLGDLAIPAQSDNIYLFNKQGSEGETETKLIRTLLQNNIWLTRAYKGKLPSESFSLLEDQYPDCKPNEAFVCIKVSNSQGDKDAIGRFEGCGFDDFYALLDEKGVVDRISPLLFPSFKDEH